jgi:hypothetical protein
MYSILYIFLLVFVHSCYNILYTEPEGVKADYKNGTLTTVTLPKKEIAKPLR